MKKSGYFLLLVLCCTVFGCGEKPKLSGLFPVKGKLTLNGSPVEGAMVTLVPKSFSGDARSARGTTDAKGEFTVSTLDPNDGALPGEYSITVTKMEYDGPVPTEAELDAARDAGRQISIKTKNAFPAKYAKSGTSGLTVTVVSGKNEDLILELQ